MKKVFLLLSVVFLLCGCVKEEKEEEIEEPLTFQFVDVKGNSYEAELLDQVPKCKYDYSKLVTKEGYQD